MRARVQQIPQTIFLVEEHPVRNLLYRRYIAASGFSLSSSAGQLKSLTQPLYTIAVVSIPDDITTHARYRALLNTLPAEVSCVALSSGVLPSMFNSCGQLVRHINRADTHPSELVAILKSITSE